MPRARAGNGKALAGLPDEGGPCSHARFHRTPLLPYSQRGCDVLASFPVPLQVVRRSRSGCVEG